MVWVNRGFAVLVLRRTAPIFVLRCVLQNLQELATLSMQLTVNGVQPTVNGQL